MNHTEDLNIILKDIYEENNQLSKKIDFFENSNLYKNELIKKIENEIKQLKIKKDKIIDDYLKLNFSNCIIIAILMMVIIIDIIVFCISMPNHENKLINTLEII